MSDSSGAGRRGRKGTRKAVSPEAARIGKLIRQARGSRSLEQLERDLKISNQSLSKFENGLTNPEDKRARRTLQLLAAYLQNDFGLDWLKPYAKHGSVLSTLGADKGEMTLIRLYQEMSPANKVRAIAYARKLRAGETVDTTDATDAPPAVEDNNNPLADPADETTRPLIKGTQQVAVRKRKRA